MVGCCFRAMDTCGEGVVGALLPEVFSASCKAAKALACCCSAARSPDKLMCLLFICFVLFSTVLCAKCTDIIKPTI